MIYKISTFLRAEKGCLKRYGMSFKDYEITDAFMKLVEQQIHEAPEYYLWTHKRWKHRKV